MNRMEDFEEGRAKFLELVSGIDGEVDVVIPTTPSNGQFLISLTKGPNRKFLTVHEDDLLDLPSEADVRAKTTTLVREAIAEL